MTSKAKEARAEVLRLIERAQNLYTAAQTACPLQGWCDQWEAIGDHADATKRLWHKLNDGPRPTKHDREDEDDAERELDFKLGEGLV
jgi:hypothetical protein